MQDDFSAGVAEGYERYFGLAEAPFKLTSSPKFLFESSAYLAAFKEIDYALSRHEPIIVVTGPIGTGKTTLCRMIGERRGPRTVVAIISSPPQTRDDMFRQILDGFGLVTDDTRHVVEASHFGLLKVFQQFFDSLVALKAQAIVVFDEAHHLRPDILEEIRLLSNVDTDHQTLQIVLVGQPELDELLARTELGPVQQRVSRRHRLEPLQLSEVAAYVARRLSVARSDQRGGEPTFTETAIQAVASVSRGVPRVVNILCDRALENAWSNRTHSVDRAAVLRAAASLNIEAPPTFAAARPFEPTPKPVEPTPKPVVEPAPKPVASVPFIRNVRLKRSHAQIAVATGVAMSVLLVWMFRGRAGVPESRATTPQPPAVRQAGRPAATDRPAPTTPVPAIVANENLKPGQFLIVVSSFKTRDRATKVAADILALGLPGSVRTNSGWEQVVVGPYSIRTDAVAAQDRLENAHFPDTKLVQGDSAPAGTAATPAQLSAPVVPSAPVRPSAPVVANAPTAALGDLPLDDLLSRATVFAGQGNVKGLQQIRDQVVRRQAAGSPISAESFTAALNQLERNLDEARRRQLEQDRRQLTGKP